MNGQDVVVDGGLDEVVERLTAGRRTLIGLESGEDKIYVNPSHVTHLRQVVPPFVGATYG